MIIGLTGPAGAGKGRVAGFLIERGFIHRSLLDTVSENGRSEAAAAAEAMRAERGPGALARLLLKTIDFGVNNVVDAITTPAEVELLRSSGDFVLLHVTANDSTRFTRLVMDGRAPADLASLREQEAGDAEGWRAMAALADYTVDNEGTVEDLHERLHPLVLEILRQKERPGWDDYFMNIAHEVAMRSNCIKRRVGAVIALERRIVSTGYNGTPRGARNCNEGGCPRCNALARSGTGLGECLCSHAEENAITQAAYHGTSVAGGTIYVTLSPCLMCTKMIINAGIREVVFNADYPLGETSIGLLTECGVDVRQHRAPKRRG